MEEKEQRMNEDDNIINRKRALSLTSTPSSKKLVSDQAITNASDDRVKKLKIDKESEDQETSEKDGKQYVKKPHVHDVLCGRGGGTNNHTGNERFRILVHNKKRTYLNSSKREKPLVSKSIVDEIRNMNPPGRFLSKCEKTQMWYDIGDQKAREKTSQALREGAPEIRRELGVVDSGGATSAKNYSKQIETTDIQNVKSEYGNMSTPIDVSGSGPLSGSGVQRGAFWPSSRDMPLHMNSMHHREHNVGTSSVSVQGAAFLSPQQPSHLTGPHRQYIQQQKVPSNHGRKESSVGPATNSHPMSWSSSDQLHPLPQSYLQQRSSLPMQTSLGRRSVSDSVSHSGSASYMPHMKLQRHPHPYPIERNSQGVSLSPNEDLRYWHNPSISKTNGIFDDPLEIEKKITSSEKNIKQSKAKQSSITVTGSIEVGKRITFKTPALADSVETTEPKIDSKLKPSNHFNKDSSVSKTHESSSVFEDVKMTEEYPKLRKGLEIRLSRDDYKTRLKVEGKDDVKTKKWEEEANLHQHAGLLGLNPDEMIENMKNGISIKDMVSKNGTSFDVNVKTDLKFSIITEEINVKGSGLSNPNESKPTLLTNEESRTKLTRSVIKDNLNNSISSSDISKESNVINAIMPKFFTRKVTTDNGETTKDLKTSLSNFASRQTDKMRDVRFYLQMHSTCTDAQNKVIHALQDMGVSLSVDCSSK